MSDSPIADDAITPTERPSKAPVGLRRILVGFDERPASRDALTLAGALCQRTGGELTIASVRPYWPELIGQESYESALARDEAWVSREATKVLDGQPFSSYVVGGGHETGGLKEIAAAERADLIVVGSSHRGLFGRVFPGSVGERVLDNAPCAVAVAPLGLADTGLELDRIAVGYDGSKQAAVALDLAATLAESAGAALLILAAVEIEIDTTGLQPVTAEAAEEARIRRHLEQAQHRVPRSVEAETRLLRGAADHVLVEAARDADLLVLGSRGHYAPARRLFLGSVAARVMREAPCATLITPA
jgi:nucleotide-binding universal stress UspA family protein